MWNNILFDLDGTLTDPKIGITRSVQFALRHYGINVENLDELCSFIGPPLLESFKKHYSFDDQKAKKAISKYREYFSSKGIYENSVYDGVFQMLSDLKSRGKIIILATSKPTVFAESILSHFGIKEFFDFIGGSNLNGSRSEKAEVIEYTVQKCNIDDFSSSVMIGDREYDIFGAKKVGMTSVGVLYGYGSYKELKDARADKLISSIKDLHDFLICEKTNG